MPPILLSTKTAASPLRTGFSCRKNFQGGRLKAENCPVVAGVSAVRLLSLPAYLNPPPPPSSPALSSPPAQAASRCRARGCHPRPADPPRRSLPGGRGGRAYRALRRRWRRRSGALLLPSALGDASGIPRFAGAARGLAGRNQNPF